MVLPVHRPRYHPTSPHTPLPGKVEQAVATQRAQQWIKRERTRYFANPTAPLIPESRPSQEQAEKPERDAVVQTVQEARYEDFGFMIVRLDHSVQSKWTRYNESFNGPIERSVAESAGGEIIVDELQSRWSKTSNQWLRILSCCFVVSRDGAMAFAQAVHGQREGVVESPCQHLGERRAIVTPNLMGQRLCGAVTRFWYGA